MNTNNLFISFVIEIINRIGQKSPKLFVYLRYASLATAALTGLPEVLNKLLGTIGYEIPPVLTTLENKTVAVAGLVGTFFSLLPIKGDTVAVTSSGEALSTTDPKKIPFTAKVEKTETDSKPVVPVIKHS